MTEIHHGDCLSVMASMPAESIDAIVTDPPYGLSFMGREWDHGVPGEPFWTQALRVAKPGAHLVAFGGTRTYHRLACAIEDAGWEIRDCLGWLYGSGFPKSLDVSKAIDRAAGENRARRLEFTAWMRSTGITAETINTATRSNMASHYLTDKQQPAIATADMFDLMRPHLPEVPEHIERLIAERTGIEWTAYVSRPKVGSREAMDMQKQRPVSLAAQGLLSSEKRVIDITAPATPAAEKWQGWGTALKPAWEPIILARKPLIGTVAANVQAHGTGALNIDGCRVETDEAWEGRALPNAKDGVTWGGSLNSSSSSHPLGRWPANIVHDGSEEVLAVFPQEAGGGKAGLHLTFGLGGTGIYHGGGTGALVQAYGDGGSAARFFYCAKADKAERGPGNNHPTVKPLALMRWLVRLMTPPGGTVLDPFMGSGTTLLAARSEGFDAIGIDLEAHHIEIARTRLKVGLSGVGEAQEVLDLGAAGA